MSKPGISFGLSFKKGSSSKPAPSKRKPTFGGDDDSDDDTTTKKGGGGQGGNVEVITELDGFEIEAAPASPEPAASKKDKSKGRNGAPPPPLSATKSTSGAQFGDLSEALSARKHAEAAQSLDPSIYDYDSVYDSLKPKKKEVKEDVEKRPKYMGSLMAAATVRERDRLIAEEKRLAREREAEGDEFADKEKFVTEAYKKQQEENRRLEEEERRREEEEAKKNKNKGMTGFYKEMLDREEKAHAEIMRAAEEAKKAGPKAPGAEAEGEKEKTESELAQEIIDKGGKITINEDGQVVDKRQLLKGGLNVGAKKKAEVQQEKSRHAAGAGDGAARRGVFSGSGGKQAMRERQSRMLEAQLEESLKRAREEEEEEQKKVELASKSRKTEADISSAKERYLARKRAAEEAKKKEAAAAAAAGET